MIAGTVEWRIHQDTWSALYLDFQSPGNRTHRMIFLGADAPKTSEMTGITQAKLLRAKMFVTEKLCGVDCGAGGWLSGIYLN
jgi:hypothetical protein